MERYIQESLLLWKDKSKRKPLILQGARQVGKTFAISKFGAEHFQQTFKLDFLADKSLKNIFENIKLKDILERLEFRFSRKINLKNDLLFFDEIQECPMAITCLKYFYEELPELAIIGAGSYLGIMTNENSFPVGKVEYLAMTPVTFEEFLMALDPDLWGIYSKIIINEHQQIPLIYHEAFYRFWIKYVALGGMPEVISTYLSNIDQGEFTALTAARVIQNQILEGYKSDFAKHSGKTNATHILHVFDSIPLQLSKSHDEAVKRYHFTGVIPNQKGFERIRGPLTWLTKSRLCIKSYIASKSEHPLKGYCEDNKFKIYFFDIGLLQASLQIPMEAIINEALGSYKGYIAENFVAQELFNSINNDLFNWQEGAAEVEFLLSTKKEIIPLEVKSSKKFSRTKSLDSYISRYAPPLAYKVCPQNRGFDKTRNMLTLPIYLVGKIK